jgi:hypothetical protein
VTRSARRYGPEPSRRTIRIRCSFRFLLTEVATNPTAELAPASQRVAIVPNANTISTQESVSTFVTSIVALAKLSFPPFPDADEPDVLRNGWRSMRNILYLLHMPGMTQADYARASDQYWKFLEDEHLLDYPMRVIRDRWRDHDETSLRFLDWSKDRLLRMSRDALTSPRLPRSWFSHTLGYSLPTIQTVLHRSQQDPGQRSLPRAVGITLTAKASCSVTTFCSLSASWRRMGIAAICRRSPAWWTIPNWGRVR